MDLSREFDEVRVNDRMVVYINRYRRDLPKQATVVSVVCASPPASYRKASTRPSQSRRFGSVCPRGFELSNGIPCMVLCRGQNTEITAMQVVCGLIRYCRQTRLWCCRQTRLCRCCASLRAPNNRLAPSAVIFTSTDLDRPRMCVRRLLRIAQKN